MEIRGLILSIIIPSYNRPGELTNCLHAISHLDFPRERFEVIVVDDGGEHPLNALLAPFHSLIDIKIVITKHGGPAKARNAGASKATGKYLVFTDDDCHPAVNWLSCILECASEMPTHTIGGRTVNGLSDNIYSSVSQLLISYIYEYYKPSNKNRFFTSNNLTISYDLFHSIGGFNEKTYSLAAAEDRDFCYRWQQHGYSMIYDPRILIHHYHELNFFTFIRQHFNYGRAAQWLHHSYKDTIDGGIHIEPLSFYIGMFHYPFQKEKTSKAIPIIFLLFISQLGHFLGYFKEFFKRLILH
jgi:GT2 family glycosyltransferase